MVRRPLEDHVLQQVGHAGLAVAFVPRTDQHGQVDRDGRLRRVGIQQDRRPLSSRYSVIPSIVCTLVIAAGAGLRGAGDQADQ